MKKIVLAGILALTAFFSFSEQTDHDVWLPSFNPSFEKVYFAFDGGVTLPVVFSELGNITSAGYGLSFSFGYDADGWLLGVHSSFLDYGKSGGLFESFFRNSIGFEISKIFTKELIKFTPSWLDIRVKTGISYEILNADYFKNEELKELDIKKDGVTNAVSYSAGLFLELNRFSFFTVYVGSNVDFICDVDGVFVLPVFALGIRETLGGVGR